MNQYHTSHINNSPFKRVKNYFNGLLLAILWIVLIGVVSACNLPGQTPTQPSDQVMASMVASTLQAMTKTAEFSAGQPETPTSDALTGASSSTPENSLITQTPTTSSTGKVTGLVCYIEVTSTPLVVYFQNTGTGQVVEMPVSVSNYQAPYTTELEPGSYIAYAWTSDFSIGGTYSACGSVSGCSDATPKSFTVNAGQTVEKIDVCDWSHGPFDVPYPPGFQPEAKFGIISGGVYGYPYGELPQLTIVAFNKSSGYWYWVGTAVGQSYFTITDIPAGTYQVVAYDGSGHAGGTSVNIELKGGQTANADINNWAGSFPSNPLK